MNPLVFEPFLRPQVWGGRKLAALHKTLPDDRTFGESWELSAHPLHISRVSEGEFAGVGIDELWTRHTKELTGHDTLPSKRFPLLFKYLEANELLSVQVHPTDALARELLGDELGKTEAWIVLEAEPTGRVYAGLKPDITRDDLMRHLDAGTVADCLHSFHPQPGDCVFLPAGTVHAVGGGVLFAEVQQTSDATFRLFDWNRVGTDGKPRQLHKDEALAAIDWSRGPVEPIPGTSTSPQGRGADVKKLVDCDYFVMTRYDVRHELTPAASDSFEVWMVLGGEGILCTEDGGYRRAFTRGETVLVPAACANVVWQSTGAAPLYLLRVCAR